MGTMERRYCACLVCERCGFNKACCGGRTHRELLLAALALLPSVADTLSDWAVTFAFYSYDGGTAWWFQAAVGIQLLAGLAIGVLLNPAWLAPSLWAESRGAQRVLLGWSVLLLGVLGLGPAVAHMAPVRTEAERHLAARLRARLLCLVCTQAICRCL